jgi:plasmid maintenance system killer protein
LARAPIYARGHVRAHWRVIFRFDGDAEGVDYVDYH